MRRYIHKETQPLIYRHAEGVTTKYGLAYFRKVSTGVDSTVYQVWRVPHYTIGWLTYDFVTHRWSAYQSQDNANGSSFVLVDAEGVTRDTAIMALQYKDPLNWGKDKHGAKIYPYPNK